MTEQHRPCLLAATVLATALTACGTSSDIKTTPMASSPAPTLSERRHLPCDPPTGLGAARIRVQWEGPWDTDAAPALIERFESAIADADVEVAAPVEVGTSVAMLLGADPPTLARVPADSVRALARAGRISPIDDCVDARLDADGELDAARELGLVDHTRYGIAGNVDFSVMLYDAGAFERAGLDPTSPPTTWSDLHDAAVTLRDRAGIAHPIASLSPATSLVGDPITDEISPSGRTWLEIRDAGLLLGAGSPAGDRLPPLGDGSAAIEFIHASGLWGYAAALAGGQAPDADLRVAPRPGTDGPRVTLGGDVWVVSARSTPEQATLATALLAWLVAAPQQATLHTLTDLFPTTSSAAADAATTSYWTGLPLLAAAWTTLSRSAVAPADWTTEPGAALSANAPLASADEASARERSWAGMKAALDASRTVDPALLLACVYPVHEPPRPLTLCVPPTTS